MAHKVSLHQSWAHQPCPCHLVEPKAFKSLACITSCEQVIKVSLVSLMLVKIAKNQPVGYFTSIIENVSKNDLSLDGKSEN
jgi:hypothetical protein